MRITMIGHSTVLIQTNGKKILTDPYFGTWGNPGFARCGRPAKLREEMIAVDGILVSHNHWDHTDKRYLRMLGETPVLAPRLMSRLLGGRNVIGVKAWESRKIGGVTITAVPAIHLTATVGYVLESENQRIYFAGDTFYSGFMEVIGEKFEIDVALMPVTTYRIPMTMSEKGAVKAVQAIKPEVVIPIHLGIVPRLPFLRTGQTPEQFVQRLKDSGETAKVVLLQEGETYEIV